MKEAMWGVLIIMLGMLGIVIIQVLQNVTVTNDQTYYLLKETTEAAMYDSIDLSYYRTTGEIRIVSDKFAENVARRFAESTDASKKYTIKINDVIESPPKVSVSLGTFVLSFKGERFNIGQTVDSIIESKNPSENIEPPVTCPEGYTYNSVTKKCEKTIPPVCEGSDCTPSPYCEDPSDPNCNTCPVCPAGDPNCGQVSECMNGDLRFTGWDDPDVPGPDELVCKSSSSLSVTTNAKYDSCDCGKWVSHKAAVKVDPKKYATYYEYIWTFSKDGPIHSINASDTQMKKQIPILSGSKCGNGTCPDTTVYLGQTVTVTPTYVPSDAINRDLTWASNDTSIATVTNSNTPPKSLTGIDTTIVTGKKLGSTQITVTSTEGITNKCAVTVKDPWVCPTPNPVTLSLGEVEQGLIVNIPGVTFTIASSDKVVATINNIRTSGNKTLFDVSAGTKTGQINYIMKKSGYSDLPCQIKVNPNDNWKCPVPDPTSLYLGENKTLSIGVPGATISATSNKAVATISNVKTSGNTTSYKATAGTTAGTVSYTVKKTGSGLPTLTCHIKVSKDPSWACPAPVTLYYGNTTKNIANLTMPMTGLAFKVIDTSAGSLSVTSTSANDTKFKITALNKTVDNATYTISKTGYTPLSCHFSTRAWKCQNVTTTVGSQVAATKSLPSDVTAPSGIKWTTSNSSIATVIGSNTSSKFNPLKTTNGLNFTISAPNHTNLTCKLIIKASSNPNACTPGDIDVDWDTGHLWTSNGPDLCPQDFEDVTECNTPPTGGQPNCSTYKPATSKIGTISSNAHYCGYYASSYTSDGKAKWDKTVGLINFYSATISASLGSSSYTLNLTQTFNYNGWTTKVGPYTKGITVVTRNKQITGTLLSRSNSKCQKITSNTSKFVILSSEGGDELIAGTNGIQIGASLYSSPTQFNTSSGKFTSSNSSVLQISSDHHTYATMKPLKSGTVTVSYTINDSSGNPVHALGKTSGPAATYTVYIYPKCSDVYISGLSTINKYDNKDYSLKPPQPYYGGEAAWSTSNSKVLYIGDTSTYKQIVTAKGKSAGKATLTATRRVDGCKKTMAVTVKQTYVCPDDYPKEYNDNYCYDPYRTAPYSCSQIRGYPYHAPNGYCYQSYEAYYQSYGYAQHTSPDVCNAWYTIMVSGSCYYASPKVSS